MAPPVVHLNAADYLWVETLRAIDIQGLVWPPGVGRSNQ
jgi:hypothetical protein